MAASDGMMAGALGYGRQASDRHSYIGRRERGGCGGDSVHANFQPSNGGVSQSNEPPTNRGPFIPAEPGYPDAGYELKAMDCIAKNTERNDLRRLFRIEVR